MAPEPAVVWMPGEVRTEVLRAGVTEGAFCMLVDHPPSGWSLPPHRHLNESETIHVIEGEFEILIDGKRLLLSAGETGYIPGGVVHSGGNIGRGAGRRIVIFSPAGIERFLLEVGALVPGHATDLRAVLLGARAYGWEFIP